MSQKNYDVDNKQVAVGNYINKFRDEFNIKNNDYWEISNNGEDVNSISGNSVGASYFKISKDCISNTSETTMVTKKWFNLPVRIGFGITLSQRIVGQEHTIGVVSVNDDSSESVISDFAPVLISGNITVATNVWTINTSVAHNLKPSDRFIIYGCDDSRLNVGPLLVTSVVSSTSLTITSTLANATYTVGSAGYIKRIYPSGLSDNAAGFLFDNTTASNASAYNKSGGTAPYQQAAIFYRTTAALPATPAAFSDQFTAASTYEMWCGFDELFFRSFTNDTSGVATQFKRNQTLPDIEKQYVIKIRSKNLLNMTRPVCEIVSISKSGSTTATVTTNVAHGLKVDSWVQILGVRDQTNFANTTAITKVASIVNATSFTIVFGASATATSAGGAVILTHGSVVLSTPNFAIQTIQRTSNLMTVTLNTTASGFLVGETYNMYGLDPAVGADIYDGVYKVANVTGSTVIFESVGENVGPFTTGGLLIKRTDLRVHYVRAADHTRHAVEVYGGLSRGDDANNAVQVNAVVNSGVINTVSAVTASNTSIPTVIADLNTSAVTTTTTSATFTPNFGCSYKIHYSVTAVSGTSPTLDVSIEESIDGGTNWFKVYDFPRITSATQAHSPTIPLVGNRVRYVQTVGGTTPSFTRAVNRFQSSLNIVNKIRQIIDRTIVLTTLNSTTPVIDMENCDRIQLVVSVGAITTTAPAIQLEGSDDNSKFYAIGTPLTAVASSAVQVTNANINSKFVRARVSTAGVGVTADYILIKGF